MSRRIAVFVYASMFAIARCAGADAGVVKSEFIFESAPFASCHASTIVETSREFLAAWFAGSAEGKPDVTIWMARLGREMEKWSAPVEVATGLDAAGKSYPCWNPVLFRPNDGPLLLFYKVGPSPAKWWGMVKSSHDGGRSWGKAERLADGTFGPIKNKPIQTGNGVILSPSSSEHDGWRVHFERSVDGGRVWTTTPAVNDGKEIGAIQPSILLHPGNRVQAIGRTRASKRIFEVWSDDEGATWGPLTLTSLPNPNSGIDAVTLKDRRHLLVYNHTNSGRTPLNVAISIDGKEWHAAVVLESDPGEYSYPAVIQAGDGLVHITYTWKRERIKHVVIDPARLVVKPVAEWD